MRYLCNIPFVTLLSSLRHGRLLPTLCTKVCEAVFKHFLLNIYFLIQLVMHWMVLTYWRPPYGVDIFNWLDPHGWPRFFLHRKPEWLELKHTSGDCLVQSLTTAGPSRTSSLGYNWVSFGYLNVNSTTSLSYMFQCLSTLTIMNCFLMFTWNWTHCCCFCCWTQKKSSACSHAYSLHSEKCGVLLRIIFILWSNLIPETEFSQCKAINHLCVLTAASLPN